MEKLYKIFENCLKLKYFSCVFLFSFVLLIFSISIISNINVFVNSFFVFVLGRTTSKRAYSRAYSSAQLTHMVRVYAPRPQRGSPHRGLSAHSAPHYMLVLRGRVVRSRC